MRFCLGFSGPWIWISALQGQEGIRCPPRGHLTPKGTWVVQSWLHGEVSQNGARGSDPTNHFKSAVWIQNQTWWKTLLPTKLTLPTTAVPRSDGRTTSTDASSIQLRDHSWPLMEGAEPRRTRTTPGGKYFVLLTAPSRCVQGWGVSHAPPTRSPMVGVSCSPTCNPWYSKHFLEPFFGLGVDGLARLALSSYCLQSDHQTWSISP